MRTETQKMVDNEHMEQAFKDNPAIGRHKLAHLASVSEDVAKQFLRNKKFKTKKPEVSNSEITASFGSETGEIVTRSPNIKTLDDALKEAEVDLNVWDIDRHIVNFWTTTIKNNEGKPEPATNYQVKVWLKRKIKNPLEIAFNRITDRLLQKPHVAKAHPRQETADPHMLEISLFDHHFGKLAWSPETGTDYDVKIAERLYLSAVENLLAKAKGFEVETILLPFGQDFLHVNDQNNTTANGTAQDVDTRLAKIFELASMAVIQAVEMCSTVAPVEILWVPGNHDRQSSYYLAKYLAAYYRDVSDVTVNVEPTSRKYKHYGINLIGFTHGDEEPHRDLPNIMSGECRDIWGQVKQCEWHIGHLHKKKEMRTVTGDTFGSVMVRILPSLSGTDAWHYKKGYTQGMRAAEAYLWSKSQGYTGHLSVNAYELGE